MQWKKRIYENLEVAAPGDHSSKLFDIFILSMIASNAVALVLETVDPFYERGSVFFKTFEAVSVLIFSVEYLLRIWSCTVSAKYALPISGRLRFAATPLAVIDILAILPFYFSYLGASLLGADLRFLRAVRLFRMFRLAKLGRYSVALRTLGAVLADKKEHLLLTLFILALLLLGASSLMYYAENGAQPEQFSSIPAAMWWAVATLTTVGYGDVCPVTGIGKMVAAVIAILGIGMLALPTSILGAAFVEEMQNPQRRPRECPHCGREILD